MCAAISKSQTSKRTELPNSLHFSLKKQFWGSENSPIIFKNCESILVRSLQVWSVIFPFSSHWGGVEGVTYRLQLLYRIKKNLTFHLRQNLASLRWRIKVLWDFFEKFTIFLFAEWLCQIKIDLVKIIVSFQNPWEVFPKFREPDAIEDGGEKKKRRKKDEE